MEKITQNNNLITVARNNNKSSTRTTTTTTIVVNIIISLRRITRRRRRRRRRFHDGRASTHHSTTMFVPRVVKRDSRSPDTCSYRASLPPPRRGRATASAEVQWPSSVGECLFGGAHRCLRLHSSAAWPPARTLRAIHRGPGFHPRFSLSVRSEIYNLRWRQSTVITLLFYYDNNAITKYRNNWSKKWVQGITD